MVQSTRQLHEELAWLSAQLEAARDLEHAAEERHSDEDMAETEAALQGRREEVLGLRERRTRLVKELDRRAVAEKGWEPDRNQGDEALPGTGSRAGRLRIGPHPLLPERGYVIYEEGEEVLRIAAPVLIHRSAWKGFSPKFTSHARATAGSQPPGSLRWPPRG
jgi:hypothetical protein